MVNLTPGAVDEKWDPYFEPPHEWAGLGIVAATGTVSTLTTLGLLSYILWHGKLSPAARRPAPAFVAKTSFPSFLRDAPGKYLVSLLLSNLLHGLGYSFGYHWARIHAILPGAVCDAQGVLLGIADLGCSIWSLALAYHTFSLLYLIRHPPAWLATAVLWVGWSLSILMPVIACLAAMKHGRFYDYSGGLWCWISGRFDISQLLFYFIPAFTSIIASLMLYSLIFLKTKRTFEFRRQSMAELSSSTSSAGEIVTADGQEKIGGHLMRVARGLLLYPIIYSCLIIPVSVVKLGSMAGWRSPFSLACVSGVLLASTGWIDVILFLYTRRSFIIEARAASRGARSLSGTVKTSPRSAPAGELDVGEFIAEHRLSILGDEPQEVREEGFLSPTSPRNAY